MLAQHGGGLWIEPEVERLLSQVLNPFVEFPVLHAFRFKHHAVFAVGLDLGGFHLAVFITYDEDGLWTRILRVCTQQLNVFQFLSLFKNHHTVGAAERELFGVGKHHISGSVLTVEHHLVEVALLGFENALLEHLAESVDEKRLFPMQQIDRREPFLADLLVYRVKCHRFAGTFLFRHILILRFPRLRFAPPWANIRRAYSHINIV